MSGRQWRQGSIDGGGFMTSVAIDPSGTGTLLCGGDVSGVHRSMLGRRWADRNGNRATVNSLKVACLKWHPTTPGVVYACAGLSGNGAWSGLYASTDYGSTWSLLSTDVKFAANRNAAAGLPNPWPRSTGNLLEFVGTTMYAGTFKDGLKRSTDGGITWTPIALNSGGPFYIRSITQDAAVPHRLFVATYNAATGGVYRIDGADGATPTVTPLTNSPAECEAVTCINGMVYGAAGTGLYAKASNLLDDSWTTLLPTTNKWYEITGYQQAGSTVLYAGAYKGTLGSGGKYSNILRSTNGGATWEDILQTATISYTAYERNSAWWLSAASPLSMLGTKRYACTQIAIDPNDHNRICVAGTHGVWMSEDYGASWKPALREVGATINQLVLVNGNNALISDADWNFIRSSNLFLSEAGMVGKEVPADGFSMCSDGTNWYVGSGNNKVNNQGGSVYVYNNFTTLSRDSKWDLAGAASSAQDTFARTVSGGWGSADLGGTWTNASGALNRLSVTPGAGTINATLDNTLHQQQLNSLTLTDCYAETTVTFDRIPTGAYTEARIVLRADATATNYYAATLRLDQTGVLTIYPRKFNGTTYILPSATITDSYTPGTAILATALMLGNTLTATGQVVGETADDVQTVTYMDDGTTRGPVIASGSPGLAVVRQSGSGGAIVTFGLSEWQSPSDSGIAGAWPIGMATGKNASNETLLVAAAQGKGIWRRNITTNSSWTRVANGFGTTLPANKRLPITWSKVNSDTVWAFDLNKGVYRSLDYGATWSQVWTKTGDGDYYHGWIVADPTNGEVVWVVADDGVYKVTNARTGTWTATPVSVGFAPGPITIASNGDIYIADVTDGPAHPPALWLSTDHGSSWKDIADDTYRSVAIIPRDIAAKADGTVLVTTNGNGVLVYAPVGTRQYIV